MRIFQIGLLSALVLGWNALALAEDAPAKLPKDGWWVRYFLTMKGEGINEEVTIKRTYSLVGTTTENGEKCRWVEMNSVQMVNGKDQTDILKFLVPERELLEGEKPLDSLLRAWRKINDGDVEEQKFNQPLGVRGFAGSADFYFGHDLVIFAGAQRKTKSATEKKVVEYQQGRLEIAEGQTGTHVATRKALTNGETQAFNTEFTVWNDAAVAPGCAAIRERIEYRRNDTLIRTIVQEFVIEDFGMDARSALPENN